MGMTGSDVSAGPQGEGSTERWARRPAVRAAMLYAVLGAVWIFSSDRVVDALVRDPGLRSAVQTVKGWAFVAASAALVYIFVSRQERAQRELRRARADLDEAERVGRVGSWAWDADFDRLELSEGAYRALGLRRDAEPTLERLLEAVHPDDRGRARAWVEAVLGGERPGGVDLRILRPDGGVVVVQVRGVADVDEAGTVTRVIGTVHDVTERKRLEERLRALHEIDRALLSSRSTEEVIRTVLVRLLALTGADRGSVARFDPRREVLTVYAVEDDGSGRLGPGLEVPSASLGEALEPLLRGEVVITPDVRERAAKVPALALLVEQGFRSAVSAPMRADGRFLGMVSLQSRSVGAFDEDLGEVLLEVADQLAVALVQAELRQELERRAEELERRVEERTAELRSLNEELEAFAAAASHDLRAPLRAIVGFARALEEDHAQALGEGGREHLGRILRAAERMDVLITDVLAYSRMARAELALEPVPLERAVEEALDTLDAEIRRTGAHVEVARPLPRVMAHAATLARVLTNLLSNALTFTKPGTRPSVRIVATQANGWVRFSVSDEGIGIAPEHLERIFRPFERLHGAETYPGTGFGLAIVRRAVERMGGRCGAESELGRGSTFWLELPASGAEASSAGVEPAT
jgi:PAS domain S-box-containing protein